MRGFALIDVLVATAIITTGLLAMVQLMAGAVAVNVAAKRHAIAAVLASQKVEELIASTEAAPLESVEYADEAGVVIGAGGAEPIGTAYVRRSTVRPLPAAPARLLVIRVIVEPSSARGRQTISLAAVTPVRP